MIRSYKASDFGDIEQIYIVSKKDEFAGEKFDVVVTPLSDDKEMLDLFHTSNIYVFEKSGVVGFSGVKEAYISWLFVHPDFRYQGIGKELLLHMLSKLNGEVSLNVARSNIAATNLYKNLGFQVAKEFTGKFQNNPIVVWKMSIATNNG
jgi:ribosomal protein S18 acetylase RimI-like enzyme